MSKNILQHLAFWLIYLLLLSVNDLIYYQNFYTNFIGNIYTTIPYAFLVYLNLFFLLPSFLLKKKLFLYLTSIVASILILTYFSSWHRYFYFDIIHNLPSKGQFFISAKGRMVILTEVLVLIGITMTLYLLKEWYQKERYAKELEKKNLETELHLLKSQINPHFLFNALNSIYVTLDQNLNKGKDILIQFSDVLRHQLYETNKKTIALSKEIENLSNYIGIEKVRHKDIVSVKSNFPKSVNGLQIPPMLLLPIVENAFKHGQSSNGYWIKISMKILSGNIINFEVKNSYVNNKTGNTNGNSGIGLANVKRRLELIYSDKHTFNSEKENSTFKVNLKIDLNGN